MCGVLDSLGNAAEMKRPSRWRRLSHLCQVRGQIRLKHPSNKLRLAFVNNDTLSHPDDPVIEFADRCRCAESTGALSIPADNRCSLQRSPVSRHLSRDI